MFTWREFREIVNTSIFKSAMSYTVGATTGMITMFHYLNERHGERSDTFTEAEEAKVLINGVVMDSVLGVVLTLGLCEE